jgi:hypothetical protein
MARKMILMDPRILESMQQKPYVPPDTLNDSLRLLDTQMEHILNREDLSPHDKVKQYQKTLQLYTTRLNDYRNKPLGLVDVKPSTVNTPTTEVSKQQENITEPKKETIDITDSEPKTKTASPDSKVRPLKKYKKTYVEKTPPSKRTRSKKTKTSTTKWDEWEKTKH